MPRARRGTVTDPYVESYIDACLGALPEPYPKARIDPATLDAIYVDCQWFRDATAGNWEAVTQYVHPADIGCDLWVTRNNRTKPSDPGMPGFWAREYSTLGVTRGWVSSAQGLYCFRLLPPVGEGGALHGEWFDWHGEVQRRV